MRLPAGPLARDGLVAAVLTLVTQGELLFAAARVEGSPAVQHAAFAVMTGSVILRRRAPLWAALICAAGMALQTLAGPAPVVGGFLAMLIVVASLGYHASIRTGVVGLLAIAASATLFDIIAAELVVADLVANTVIVLLAWWSAHAVRTSTERRIAAEVTKDRAARDAVLEERSRIAHDLHDSVAHALTLITLQAGGARERTQDELTSGVLGAIEQEGREALTDMHRFLRLLGQPADGPAEAPGLQDLEDLVTHLQSSGVAVRLWVDPTLDAVPASVSSTVYRVVQEGLTNAVKHSGAARTSVQISRSGERLVVEVTDDGATDSGVRSVPSGAGYGLVGLRERLALFNGTLTAGRDDRGWRLNATIPLAPPGAP